jgi:hypothetical protein
MPGDEIVDNPNHTTTRAVTVQARPEDIWPWLAQMGYKRGGLYSYDALDILFRYLDAPSSRTILPEFQELHAGDVIPIGNGGGFYVHRAEPNRCLVIGPEDRSVPISWSTAFYPTAEGDTRLVTRVRGRLNELPGGRVAATGMDVAAFIMVRKWLLVLKERAEGLAASRLPVPLHEGIS